MDTPEVQRKLAAILCADVAGYSRLMADDHEATLTILTAYREVFARNIAQHQGRIVNSPGDAVLAEFGSVVDAVACSAEIQRELAEKNAELPSHRKMEFRIGVNLGDVLVKDNDLFGDGVNIAARLQALADPGGIMISGTAFDQVESRLPLEYADLGEQQVKNIPKAVRTYKVLSMPGAAAHEAARHDSLPESAKPSIAVLPFVNMSGDPEQEYFVDGITEDIITGLAQFRELSVLARNTTFQFKGRAVDIRKVGQELGARYVLEGSVRKTGNAVRLTAQLIDARDGGHLWAETYSRALAPADVFSVQDELTERVVGVIADSFGIVSSKEFAERSQKPPHKLRAYDWVLQAFEYYKTLAPADHRRIRNGLELAMKDEPGYADGWGWLSAIYRDEEHQGYNPRPDSLGRAREAAMRALAIEPKLREANVVLAHVHLLENDLEAFTAQVERTAAWHPNSSDVQGSLGLAMVFAGFRERGMQMSRKAAELNATHPGWLHAAFAVESYMQGDYAAALRHAQMIRMPNYWTGHAILAAILGQLGRSQDAQAAVARLLEQRPEFVENPRRELGRRFKDEKMLDAILLGLRKAGLPIQD